MAISETRLRELAAQMAALMQDPEHKKPARPQLRLVQPAAALPADRMDAITRESHLKLIGHLRRRWGRPMQELIDQACFGVAAPEQLGDEELVTLHRDLERAQDCMRDGVTFEDAGLLRSRYG